MFSEQTILIINIVGLVFMITMLVVLAAATRMKGSAGWAAFILVAMFLPTYLSNIWRDLHLGADLYPLFSYLRTFFGSMLMPSLWFFAQAQFDKTFRLTARSLFHTVLPFASLLVTIIYYAPMTVEQVSVEMEAMAAGVENLAAIIINYIIAGMFFGYFIAIYFYIRKRKKFLLNNYSDSDYITVMWTQKFFIMFFSLFFITVVAYNISPRTDAWLCPIINATGTAYLVYIIVFHSTAPYIKRLPTPSNSPEGRELSPRVRGGLPIDQMREICDRITDFLTASGAYINPDFSLSMLAVETGISPRNLSYAFNGYMNKNFFDLINEMRVEEAKKRLTMMKENHYTIEAISDDCGFRSRTSFYAAFRKKEGKTPTQWLNDM